MLRTVIEALGSFFTDIGAKKPAEKAANNNRRQRLQVEIFVKGIAVARQTVFYSCHTTVQNK